MTNKNLKQIVEQIKKLAAPPPKPGQGYQPSGRPSATPAGGAGAAPAQTGGPRVLPGHGGRGPAQPVGHGGGGSNISIIAMQQALQDLAQTVTSQINLQDVFSGDPMKEKDAKARDAFGVFLTKNYMRNTKVPGVEYDPNPAVKEIKDKTETDPTRMSIVMDTRNRVGNPKKGENFVDGAWGKRTNAAVRDAFAFASGLLDFVDDVNRFATKKMQIRSYDRTRLSELEKFATVENSLTNQQKVQAAPEVTKHVKSIKSMYNEVKENILQHPAYSQFIEGQSSFKTYTPKVTTEMVAALKQQFPQGFQITLVPSKNMAQIGIDSLLSKEAFEKWLSQFPDNKLLTPEEVITQIYKQTKLTNEPGY